MYNYSYFIQCIEFHIARLLTKFYLNFPHYLKG